MIDSINPRIMANNIKELAANSNSYTPPDYSTTEFDTGRKYDGKTVYAKILTGTLPETTSETNIFQIPARDTLLMFVWNAAKGTDIYLPGSEYINGRISGGYFKIKLSSPTPYGAKVTAYMEYTKTES